MAAALHLIKLCVGVEHPKELTAWQARRRRETGASHAFHVTRMFPRRADDLLAGGSLYWIMKGMIRARQRILALEPRDGDDGITRCAIILDPDVIKVSLTPRRAFQGWRYLDPAQAPDDLAPGTDTDCQLPDGLQQELARLGVR